MKIFELDSEKKGADPNKLLGLVDFLAGRIQNTNAQKEISQDAFINAARSLGIMITPDTLPGLIAQAPLNAVLEPLNSQSNNIQFKGAAIGPSKMTVPQAQQVVNKMAKKALQKRS